MAEKAAGLDLVHCNAEDLPLPTICSASYSMWAASIFQRQAKAINEMLRVAKPGTKIMIADETADFIQKQYKKPVHA